ncbi:hypothetical protein C6499_11810 [Candidatus Poribacteria bacterium]|nr:MAG: hypothetical protein C6499_11810 [Candidatus Poribacteria bacterium]
MLNPIQSDAKNAATAYFHRITPSVVRSPAEPEKDNVVGWGIGTKSTDRTARSDNGVVRVYVRELPGPTIPERFGDLPTDVIEVGQIVAYRSTASRPPVLCGVSIGHPNVTAGTLGCLVEKDGNHYILSNNHVLADTNNATPGDPVIQPGSVDGGNSPDDDIATLEPYEEIDFSGAPNHIDAAIALIGDSNQTLVKSEIIDIGEPMSDPDTAFIDQIVQKRGRTTKHTSGVVVDISGDFWVDYGSETAWFEDQIVVESTDRSQPPFSEGGDSGSLIVDQMRKPIALLFAGSESGITVANPIDLVLNYYNVTIVGEQGADA